jgi:diguanylate cyclase (GGDEF)-like protein
MLDQGLQSRDFVDVSTLVFAAGVLAGFLGLLLLLTWVSQREVRALAWWGSAYLIGAAAIALWGAPAPLIKIPPEWAEALFIIACGMIWSGLRLFRGRPSRPLAGLFGAALWLILCRLPELAEQSSTRLGLGAAIVGGFTLLIAYELAHERRRSLYSRSAVLVIPSFYAGVFLMPFVLRGFVPDLFDGRWPMVLAFESIIYTVGTAFIVLMMVKDNHVSYYRKVATTDGLTGLLNRGAFLEAAPQMQVTQGLRGEPVTLIMFDLDHFKSVNDRFGHATGDSVLKVFAQTALASVRATDLVARFGGEEFVAIVPESMEGACTVAERLRAAYELAGLVVDDIAVGSTVSMGLATSYQAVPNIDALLLRADEALYFAKREGRNRFRCAPEEPGSELIRAQAAARKPAEGVLRRWVARRAKTADAASTG